MKQALLIALGIALFIGWGVVGTIERQTEELEQNAQPAMWHQYANDMGYTPIYEN